MYSQAGGRPGTGRGGKGRYMKGRLPQGVDFKAYPGRSSTPLPTAESKSAERINQLKIWNEAATNDDKRRLHTAQSKQALTSAGSASRRTDSFKDARDRHSASFQPESSVEKETPAAPERDIFADRSDSESEASNIDIVNDRHRVPAAGTSIGKDVIADNDHIVTSSAQAGVEDRTQPARTITVPTATALSVPQANSIHSPSGVSVPGDVRINDSSERPHVPKEVKGCCSLQ